MSLRLIEGGRGQADAPGLLIHGASQVATLAGGIRRGAAQGDLGAARRGVRRWTRGAAGARSSPAGRAGSSASGRATASRPGLEANGYPLAALRPPRRRRRRRHARARRPAHAPAVRRHPRGRAGPAPARRRVPRDPPGRRRDPVHRRGDAPGLRGGAGGARAALARRDAPPRRHHDRGEVRLRPGPADRAAPAGGGPRARQARGRSTSSRRSWAPMPSRPSTAPARTAPRPTSEASSRSSCRASPHRAGPAPATCSASRACSPPTRAGGSCWPPPGTAWPSASTPTSWPRRAAPSWPRSSARCPRTTSTSRPTRGSPRSPAAAAGPHPTVATLLPATTWFLMADEAAPGPHGSSTPGSRWRSGTDFNPGHVAHAEPAARDDHRLPRDEALAGRGAGGRDDQRGARRRASGADAGSLEPGKLADLVIWRAGDVDQLPYWVGADLVDVVVKRGRVVYRRGAVGRTRSRGHRATGLPEQDRQHQERLPHVVGDDHPEPEPRAARRRRRRPGRRGRENRPQPSIASEATNSHAPAIAAGRPVRVAAIAMRADRDEVDGDRHAEPDPRAPPATRTRPTVARPRRPRTTARRPATARTPAAARTRDQVRQVRQQERDEPAHEPARAAAAARRRRATAPGPATSHGRASDRAPASPAWPRPPRRAARGARPASRPARRAASGPSDQTAAQSTTAATAATASRRPRQRRHGVRPCRATPAARSSSRRGGSTRDRQLRLDDGRGAHLVQELLHRVVAVRLFLADRHRHHDLRVQLGDQRRGRGGRERAADRHAGDVDAPDVAELLLRQLVADVAEVDRVERRPAPSRTPSAGRAPRPARRPGRSGRP